MKHTYRKRFDHAYEAELTADGFKAMPNLDKLGPTDVWITVDGPYYWVNIALEGDVDPGEALEATGYERRS